MNVREIMTRDVKTCRAEDALSIPAQVMWDRDCGCVPVVDSESRVLGVITDRDIVMAAHTQGTNLSSSKVASAMAKVIHACRPDDPTSTVLRTMKTQQVRRLPVIDGSGKLVGIVSLCDVSRAAVREGGNPDTGITSDEVVVTFAAIGEPRRAGVAKSSEAVSAAPESQPETTSKPGRERVRENVGGRR